MFDISTYDDERRKLNNECSALKKRICELDKIIFDKKDNFAQECLSRYVFMCLDDIYPDYVTNVNLEMKNWEIKCCTILLTNKLFIEYDKHFDIYTIGYNNCKKLFKWYYLEHTSIPRFFFSYFFFLN